MLRSVLLPKRFLSQSARQLAKEKGGKKGKKAAAVAVKEPEPIRDTTLLTTRCCGANKFVEGEDPILKADEEYPDWLWTIHTGPPKRVEDMDPNTREYWYKLRRENLIQRNLARKGVKFYTPPRSHELEFSSRIQPKRKSAGKS